MSKTILERLNSEDLRRSRSDKLLALYLERHLAELPFETARSIAAKVGVSPMTVGRFLRRAGFDGLEPLKQELRHARSNPAWQVKGEVDVLQADIREGKLLARLINQQIDNLRQVYEVTITPQWQACVDALIEASEVYVAAYQNIRGMADYMAAQLSYARPGVRYVDGLNGTYSEVLDGAVEGRLLFMIEVRRFASKALPLALEARKRGVKVVLLTDDFCSWAEEASDIALIIPGPHGPLWDGSATIMAVLDLLLSNTIVVLGAKVDQRVETLTRLQDIFGDFEKI
ncbi:MurR/RpiR family transcriptional regulator [Aquamicrobium soli]|jgi:DNA-binding MurR/RpiR family transcriptional regulator|uniref:MurR/RpiR family transcriptional regulator n=1 Tax=Aquamicrobium soli TaxID=1811518 RepID=A0ABV7KD85_9HYPH